MAYARKCVMCNADFVAQFSQNYVCNECRKKDCQRCGKKFFAYRANTRFCADCNGKFSNHPMDLCSCGKQKKLSSTLCKSCCNKMPNHLRPKKAESRMRDKDFCACGKEKYKKAARCRECHEEYLTSGDDSGTIVHRAKKRELKQCDCNSGIMVLKGHQCQVCYALELGLPAPTYSQHLILDRMGNKV